jgi:hypothetical protein
LFILSISIVEKFIKTWWLQMRKTPFQSITDFCSKVDSWG